MNVSMNDVVSRVADILDLTSTIDLDNQVAGDTYPSALTLLLRCVNMTAEELARDYFPLLKTEELTPSSGIIANNAFNKRPVEIYSVKKGGAAVDYALYPAGMKLSANAAHTIEYGYVDDERDIGESMEVHPKVTLWMLALGTLMNYSIASGKYEESLVYEKRFRESIRERLKKGGELKLPDRRWI